MGQQLAAAFRDFPLTPRAPFQAARIFELLNRPAAFAGFENPIHAALGKIRELAALHEAGQLHFYRFVVEVVFLEQGELVPFTLVFEDCTAPNESFQGVFLHGFLCLLKM
jgi:hypothetical protein